MSAAARPAPSLLCRSRGSPRPLLRARVPPEASRTGAPSAWSGPRERGIPAPSSVVLQAKCRPREVSNTRGACMGPCQLSSPAAVLVTRGHTGRCAGGRRLDPSGGGSSAAASSAVALRRWLLQRSRERGGEGGRESDGRDDRQRTERPAPLLPAARISDEDLWSLSRVVATGHGRRRRVRETSPACLLRASPAPRRAHGCYSIRMLW